jgi:hypothetical protein
MEQENKPPESSLFGLAIDPNSKAHLAEAAKWTRFLAIAGFIIIGLIIIIYGIVFPLFMSNAMGKFQNEYDSRDYSSGVMSAVFLMYSIVIGVIYFFPCFFTLRFSNHMRDALNTNDQEKLTKAFQNLKITVRYLGILMIIGLVFFAIAILAMFAFGASSLFG